MSTQMKIFLLLETSRAFGRGLMRGVIRWSRLNGRTLLIGSVGHFEREVPKIGRKENAGIIAMISSVKQCHAIRKTGLPVVAVNPMFDAIEEACEQMAMSRIDSNEEKMVVMAADHFLGNGFKHFAYCGIPHNRTWVEARGRYFRQYLAEKGHDCQTYPCPFKPQVPFQWEKDSRYLAKWLQSLPYGTALLACNDDRGRHILELCSSEKIDVPRRLAVVGIDDDELICELTNPPLSSVALDVQTGGFQAMELLAELMDNPKTGNRAIYINPLYVTERQSSDFYAFDDPLIVKALRFIKDNFLTPIGVEDVIGAMGVSRRTLERRFEEIVGHSIRDAIVFRRYERAKRLLLNTDYSINKVSVLSGFCQLQQMQRVFQAVDHCTPSEFRRTNQEPHKEK